MQAWTRQPPHITGQHGGSNAPEDEVGPPPVQQFLLKALHVVEVGLPVHASGWRRMSKGKHTRTRHPLRTHADRFPPFPIHLHSTHSSPGGGGCPFPGPPSGPGRRSRPRSPFPPAPAAAAGPATLRSRWMSVGGMGGTSGRGDRTRLSKVRTHPGRSPSLFGSLRRPCRAQAAAPGTWPCWTGGGETWRAVVPPRVCRWVDSRAGRRGEKSERQREDGRLWRCIWQDKR